MSMKVGRIRYIHPKGYGFINHSFGQYFVFYFNGQRSFTTDQNGEVVFGSRTHTGPPEEGSYVLFNMDDVVQPKDREMQNLKPLIAKWGLVDEFYKILNQLVNA